MSELQAVPAMTPMVLIERASAADVSIDKMEQLFALQLQWEANEAKKSFNRAMASFKSENIKIIKDATVDFTSSKGRTHYKHAKLSGVINQIIDKLCKYGLTHSWRTKQEGKTITVTCRISHVDGHYEEVSLAGDADESGNKNSIQAIGSAVTYLERYTLKSALGLAEEDDDGNGGNGKKEQVVDPKIQDRLEVCNTFNELQAVWNTLTKEQRENHEDVKDGVKKRLQEASNA